MWDITVDTFISKPQECIAYIIENWDKIPTLNNLSERDIKDGQLAKFCGMIQDMPNPVYYYSSYEVLNSATGLTEIKSGKYRDSLCCNENETLLLDSPNTQNEERYLYSCITIPALNEWVKPKNVNLQNQKISVDGSCSSKRNVDEMEVDDHSDSTECHKRPCLSNQDTSINKKQCEINTNFPIPCAENYSCLLHVYENSGYNLKVNDIVEACGFIHYNSLGKNNEDMHYSNIPRLHGVFLRTINTFNPFVKVNFNYDEILLKAKELRSELHLLLTQILLGDSLAADYLISHFIANIYGRIDCTVLGKFSINISNIPFKKNNYYITNLYRFISQLLPKSHYMPMSLEVMNSTQMVPKKDYEKEYLQTGLLQLTDHTHLVIDETKLGEGKLEEKGVRNVQSLKCLIEHQKLDYDFKFFTVEFVTDIPVLILSEGKSLLPSDCHIVLSPEPEYLATIDECCASVTKYLQESLSMQLRDYLTAANSISHYNLPENLQQTIENDLVEQRQAGEKSSAEDFHLRLVLARLLTLSYGEKELTKTIWDKSGEMERCRKSRLNIKNS